MERYRPLLDKIFYQLDYIFTNENYAIRFGQENSSTHQNLISSLSSELDVGMATLLLSSSAKFVVATRGSDGVVWFFRNGTGRSTSSVRDPIRIRIWMRMARTESRDQMLGSAALHATLA